MLTRVSLVKAMVFPVVMYGSKSWIIKKVKVKVKSLSCVRLFATPWTVAYQAPPSMGYSRNTGVGGHFKLSAKELVVLKEKTVLLERLLRVPWTARRSN